MNLENEREKQKTSEQTREKERKREREIAKDRKIERQTEKETIPSCPYIDGGCMRLGRAAIPVKRTGIKIMAGNGHGVGTPAPRHFFLLAETYKHPGLPAISAGPADRQTALPAVSVRPSKFEAPRPVVTPGRSLSPPPVTSAPRALLKTVAIFFFEQREGAQAPLAPAIKMSSAFCK